MRHTSQIPPILVFLNKYGLEEGGKFPEAGAEHSWVARGLSQPPGHAAPRGRPHRRTAVLTAASPSSYPTCHSLVVLYLDKSLSRERANVRKCVLF